MSTGPDATAETISPGETLSVEQDHDQINEPVYKALKEGYGIREAIRQALGIKARPIVNSVLKGFNNVHPTDVSVAEKEEQLGTNPLKKVA